MNRQSTVGAQPDLIERVRQSQLPAPAIRRQIRLQANVSLRDIANELRVTPMTILRWERGEVVPRAKHAIDYRQLLDALTAVAK